MIGRPRCRCAALAAAAIGLLGVAPSVAPAAPIAFGAYIPDSYKDPGLITSFGRKVERKPAIVLSYKNWSIPPLDRRELSDIWSRGAVPLVTWEPWTESGNGVPLAAIAAGRQDPYLRRAARVAVAWGRPIFLRFAQEMNGDWYPWGNGVGGNTPADFRHAWHHVVGLFRRHGARNVSWVWAPNEDSGGKFQFGPLYPGDDWVDWVALDGFNWGGADGWPSFTKIFGSSYDRLVELTPRPVMIAETASGEDGGDKAAWIASALGREAPRFSHIRALVWFDVDDPRGDFRPESSPESLRAFRSAVASPVYGATRRDLLATPSALSLRSLAPPQPEGGYGAPSFFERLREKLHGKYLWFAVAALAGLFLALALGAVIIRRSRRARAAR